MTWADMLAGAMSLLLFGSVGLYGYLRLFGGSKQERERKELSIHLLALTLVTTTVGAYCLLGGLGVLGDGLAWPPPDVPMAAFGLLCLLAGLVVAPSFQKPTSEPGVPEPVTRAAPASSDPGEDDAGPRASLLRYFAFVERAAFGEARSLGVPLATIPMRLVIDFTYTPDDPAFLAAFSAEELADLAAYDRLLQLAIEVLDRGGPDLLLPDLMEITEWVRAADFARGLLGRWSGTLGAVDA